MNSWSGRACLLTLSGLLLTACGTPPPQPPEPSAQLRDSDVVLQPKAEPDSVRAYEQALLEQARHELAQGRLADTAQTWEILLTLRPSEPEYARNLEETRKLIDAALAQALKRAAQLQKKGDQEAAAVQYLAALALQPDHADAMAGLRSIERDRVRRALATRSARLQPRPTAAPTSPVPGNSSSTADRNELEHASILAALGEIDAAIALLERRLALNKSDQAACQQLADVYAQKADALLRSDKGAARAALEHSLRLDGSNSRNRARLRALKPGAADTGPGLCPRQR